MIHSAPDPQVRERVQKPPTCCWHAADERMWNNCCFLISEFWHSDSYLFFDLRSYTNRLINMWSCYRAILFNSGVKKVLLAHIGTSFHLYTILLCSNPSYPQQLWSSPSFLSVVLPAKAFPLLVAARPAGPVGPALHLSSYPPLKRLSDCPEYMHTSTLVFFRQHEYVDAESYLSLTRSSFCKSRNNVEKLVGYKGWTNISLSQNVLH